MKGLLFDSTICIGCEACVETCKETYGLPKQKEQNLSSRSYTTVRKIKGTYIRRLCMHCLDPTCVSVCPVGALEKTTAGPVTYDEDKCIGCRYCMLACPFEVPTYEWDKAHPKVRKCQFCAQRVTKGEPPVCAEICPVGATIFGDRDDLIKEAKARLRKNPGKYFNYLYGEKEIGGTSTLFLSDVPFQEFGTGFRMDLTPQPLPLLTWQVLSKIPDVVLVGGVLLAGIWWITNRREEVRKYEEEKKRSSPPPSSNGFFFRIKERLRNLYN